jgi:hypothetical protein
MNLIKSIGFIIFLVPPHKNCSKNSKSTTINNLNLNFFNRLASHMEFNFPKKEGTGVAKLIPNASPEVSDIIVKLLVYNADNRMTAG